jgi:hypothetical protein
MYALKQLIQLSEAYKTRDVTYFTLKTVAGPYVRQVPNDLYCTGRCAESTCFEELCGACLQEWHDWRRETQE